MDQGPVDAGPNPDTSYDDPTQPPSPQHRRLGRTPRSFSRSASRRRSAFHEARDGSTGLNNDQLEDTQRKSRSMSNASHHGSPDPPIFPQVGATAREMAGEESESEPSETMHCHRSQLNSNTDDSHKSHRIHKFTLYETSARYWITGTDLSETRFRLLRIDRTSPPGIMGLFEDETTYNRKEMNEVLTSIDDGNKLTGGLRMKASFWGLLGFIRFTEAYYMVIITKRRQVAMIGGHYVYQVEGTELIALTTGASSLFARDRNPEETRFLGILGNLDLSKSFYFSYSYDITHSLQHNIIRQRQAINEHKRHAEPEFETMFIWNSHLLKPAVTALKHPFDWCLPVIHGFVDQSALDIFGRAIYVTIIGRRSRNFAGARFLKRGVNDLGYVANDVETEQIVSEKVTTSFHAPGPRLYSNPTYTSYLHHRGSIPLYWTQDNSGVTPKPDIDLHLQDPFYQPAALHFDNLFARYGCPIRVLNLIKSRERTPRESKLLVEFQHCIQYLNQNLPDGKKIVYKAFDMSRASKTRGADVIGSLEVIAKEIVEGTGFFRNGDDGFDEPQVQNGIARTNCIDCLDRTNAAQFIIGKRAFALQLQALGVIDRDEVDFDTDAVNIFTHMFHDHGDTIAVQYGGSHLVNTMATYRKVNQWQSSSRDMVESFKRYYHNSFLDSQRQEAYNLFLGNYVWAQGQPMLWDLTTDYYLHHSDPRAYLEQQRRRCSYVQWYHSEYLEPKRLPPKRNHEANERNTMGDVSEYDDYWLECYRPAVLSNLAKVFSYRMNSTNRYLPDRPHRDSKYDFSPFKIRQDPHRPSTSSASEKRPPRKGVTILDPQDEVPDSPRLPNEGSTRVGAAMEEKHSILLKPTKEFRPLETRTTPEKPADKAQMHLWTLNQIHHESLNPSVSDKEAHEYERYVSHPLRLPLVISTDVPSDANIDYIEYVHRAQHQDLEEEGEALAVSAIGEQDLQHFWDFVAVREDPLTVMEEDGAKKRYKAYKKWIRGKSLFKQSKVDPEYRAGA